MKCAWLFSIFLFFVHTAVAQNDIVFDDTSGVIDLGDIELQGGSGRYQINFKNAGKTPLIITRASTGDGGTMADYSHEPVAPGKKGTVAFIYIRDRAGQRSRGVYISGTSESGSFNKVITINYRIVQPPTTISITPAIAETRKLSFGEADTLTFTVTNTGTAPLYLEYGRTDINEEILVQKIVKKGEVESKTMSYYRNDAPCQPGEQMEITLVVLNIYGHPKSLKHMLRYTYNTKQVFEIPLIINGGNGSPTEQRIEQNRILYFKNGQLVRIDRFGSAGNILSELYFTNGNCYKRITYDYRQTVTVLYDNGTEVSRVVVPLEDVQE